MLRTDTRTAKPMRWAAAAALSLAAAASLFAAARPAAADGQEISGGSLEWGIKSSFVTYINGSIADGSVTPGDGATVTAGGFQFAPATGTYDPDTGDMDAAFGPGSVQFLGHNYGNGALIDLEISDLRIEIVSGAASLVADVSSRELLALDPSAQPGPMIEYNDVAIATLNFAGISPSVSGATVTFTGVPATLTEAGVPAFAEFYEAGTALDPVTFSVTLAPPATATATATATTAVPTATATTEPPTATPTTGAPTATATTPATSTVAPPSPTPSPIVTVEVPDRVITLSKTVVNPAGDTITVTGTGFLPSLSTGTRPPLAGKPSGVYIAWGCFAETWKPSEGAPSSARPTMPQGSGGVLWAVLEADRAIIGQDASVTLNPDGSFTATVKVEKDYTGANESRCGIYTYAGSGSTSALYETYSPVTFAQAPTATATSVPPTATATRQTPGAPSTGSGNSGSPLGNTAWVLLGGALLAAGAATFTVASKRSGRSR